MSTTLKENAKKLILRPDDFETVLKETGFGPAKHLGEVGEGGELMSLRKLSCVL